VAAAGDVCDLGGGFNSVSVLLVHLAGLQLLLVHLALDMVSNSMHGNSMHGE
jgi:hypothetical protein